MDKLRIIGATAQGIVLGVLLFIAVLELCLAGDSTALFRYQGF